MYNHVFDIDFKKLLRWMIPIRLRMPRVLSFLNSFKNEVTKTYLLFKSNRGANLYRIAITPQVCLLERLLNDRYDFTQRRIYIDDGIDYPPTYIYRTDELKPIYLGTQIIYTAGESGNLKDDFVIYVPSDISFEDAEMSSLVKAYKLAGTKFKIQRI